MNNQYMDIVNGLIIKNDDRLEEINQGILNRRFPDAPLKPNVSAHPVSTRQSLFPVQDLRKQPAPKDMYLDHYVEANFAPVQSNGPVKLDATHINIENELRGQNTPLHKGDLAIKHIPNNNSNLYNQEIVSTKNYVQPHPHLFEANTFEENHRTMYNNKLGKELFNNNTRTQLRQI